MRRHSREYRAAYLPSEGVSISSQVFVVSAESAPTVETAIVLNDDTAYGIVSGYLVAGRMLNERKAIEGSKIDRPLVYLPIIVGPRDIRLTKNTDSESKNTQMVRSFVMKLAYGHATTIYPLEPWISSPSRLKSFHAVKETCNKTTLATMPNSSSLSAHDSGPTSLLS